MLAELETRHQEETAKVIEDDPQTIRRKKAKAMADKALDLAKQAASKQSKRHAEQDAIMTQIVIKAGQPKLWRSSKHGLVSVETPSTERAKQLADIYLGLKRSEDSDYLDDRIQALNEAMDMVKNSSSNHLQHKNDAFNSWRHFGVARVVRRH